MNKILRISLISMLTFVCGMANAATATVTFDATTDKGTDAKNLAKDGISITIGDGTLINGEEYRIYKSKEMTISSSVGNITKIEFTCTTSGTSKYGPGCMTAAAGSYTYEEKGTGGTWTGDAASVVFTTNINQVRATKITVTYTVAEGVIAAPTITGPTEFETSSDVTITGSDGTTIYYTLDGTDPTTTSTLTGASPLTFTLDKTATVKAIAAKDGKASAVASKDFTKVEFTAATIASLNELTANKENILLTLKDAKVVYVDGKNIYVREGDKAIMFFNTGLALKQDNVVSGTVKTDYNNYNGIHEVKDNTFTAADKLTITESTEKAQSTDATVSDILALKHICDYVKLTNVKIVTKDSKNYAVSGVDSVQLYKGIDVASYVSEEKTYDITAVFNNIYKGNAELQPITVTASTTNINNIEAGEDANAPQYNLGGQRVDKAYKGVVIKKGKKYIQK